jgi:hypothetical protein
MADVNVPGASSPVGAPPGGGGDPTGAKKARRPYEPPAIEETSEFETLALNCTGLVNEQTCYQTYAYHNS